MQVPAKHRISPKNIHENFPLIYFRQYSSLGITKDRLKVVSPVLKAKNPVIKLITWLSEISPTRNRFLIENEICRSGFSINN